LAQVSKDEQYADKHWKIVQQKLKAAVSKATASAKTIAAEVAKNGAKAWPEFITEIGSGIGEISLALGHVTQARKHGVDLADPEPIGKALSQLQGKLPNRPGVFNDQQMLACSKVLEGIIKAVKQNYNV
jgi:hypothetical protein